MRLIPSAPVPPPLSRSQSQVAAAGAATGAATAWVPYGSQLVVKNVNRAAKTCDLYPRTTDSGNTVNGSNLGTEGAHASIPSGETKCVVMFLSGSVSLSGGKDATYGYQVGHFSNWKLPMGMHGAVDAASAHARPHWEIPGFDRLFDFARGAAKTMG